MQHSAPLSLIPGSWDDLVTRGALKLVNWVHDRLSQRAPTLASAPQPDNPWTGLQDRGGKTKWQRRAPRS